AIVNNQYYGDKLFGLLLSKPFEFSNEDYSFLLEQNRINHKDLITNIKENLQTHTWTETEKVKNFINVFDYLTSMKSALNIKDLITETVNRTGLLEYFLQNEVNKSDNIYAVKKIIDEAQSYMYINKGAWLGDFLNHLDTAFESSIPITIDKEDYIQNAVQLLTLHSSKGREFEYVFIPNLISKKWEGKRVNNTMTLPIDKDKKMVDEDTARYSEQLRLLFVGVTRSKHSLVMSYSNSIDSRPQELMSYLSEPIKNKEIVETYNHELQKDDYFFEVAKYLKKQSFDYSSAFNDELKARIKNFIISPSSLNSYLNCPRCFLYSNVLKIPVFDKETSGAHYGNAVHKTLQQAVMYAKENKNYPDLNLFTDIFLKNLAIEKFESQSQRDDYKQRGINCIQKYYTQLIQTPYDRIYATEYSFNYVPYGDYFLKGFIDRIEINNDGTVELYDYKTGSAKSKSQIADGKTYESYLNQLRFYKFAYELQNENIKVKRAGLIFVEETNSDFYIDLTKEDNEVIKNKIIFAYENINNLNFNPPNEAERHCEYCDYRHLCKLSEL
ncbi:MAG: PD-(D/E)XK nuclease family protein, partial [Candidatus Gastranaerophilales bacterium]|nr:PD-(D/E)XK nuclease family protein [Candidatus Gastranaerophilales bacterium]